MTSAQWTFALNLMGTFRLSTPDGVRVEIVGTKGMAIVAMLALAKDGERTRIWLQDRLWGSRQKEQAQNSLRRELSLLRKILNTGATPVLETEFNRVKLDLAQLRVDVLSVGTDAAFPSPVSGEFLEGFDIPGADGFEEWLREQRRIFRPNTTSTIGTAARQQTTLPQSELFAGQSIAAPRFSDRPALAVLPFANNTSDKDLDYVCEGLSEDLIDRLSRLRWLPVISRNSTFTFTAGSADPRTVGQKLGARYVLEGRMRPSGDSTLLALNLSDATTNLVCWAHRVPLPRERSQDALDPIVADLVGVLDTQIDHAEQLRARGSRRNHLEFNNLIWRGRWHLNHLTREESEKARILFDQALALEPDSPEALIQATYCLAWSLWARRGSDEEKQEMRRMAHRALIADPYDGRGHMLAGIAEMWLRQNDRARPLLERAVELSPSLCQARTQLGVQYNLCGDPAPAVAPLRMALRLSPTDMQIFAVLGELATSYWMLGDYAAAIAAANQSLTRRPAYWLAAVIKINALADSGDVAGARIVLGELMAAKPDFKPSFIDWIPFVDAKWNRRLVANVVRLVTNDNRGSTSRPLAAKTSS